MKHPHTQLAFAAAFWLVLAWALTASGQNVAQAPWRGRPALASRGHLGLVFLSHDAPVAFHMQGQDALATKEQGRDGVPNAKFRVGEPQALATTGVLQEPASRSGSPLQPVTVEHHGRLLVLTYGPEPGAGGLASPTGARGEPPRFAVYQGQRQIASGQFEYG
jgi:hypothetical protein